MKTVLVLGAGGFIGSHMVKRLKSEGYWIRGADLKYPDFSVSLADEFVVGDLRERDSMRDIVHRDGVPFDEIYQFAADMGGAGYVFAGEHDADIMNNSVTINLNLLDSVHKLNQKCGLNITKIFYSSSACIYAKHNQEDPGNPNCSEASAYPANPDSEYGWEKLFSERLYFAYNENYGIPVRVARFHNIFGPEGAWNGGREKSPAAICRKVAEAENGGTIEIWGDGKQTRSFLYIDECIEAVRRLMESDFPGPVNIGSEEMVTIDQLVGLVASVAGKMIQIKHINGPEGVRGRNSDNTLIKEKLGWDCKMTLAEGISTTYSWINNQLQKSHS
ncbi:MAG: NAD-dependent epimerase/dehydratase family protein [Hyphomicrobium sp.]|uniref:NAD-dependent epimerase/dehydratase family protein n=1 Tax=Hyphomicrobium sp. TaxID=82 RepID=UPI0035640BA3